MITEHEEGLFGSADNSQRMVESIAALNESGEILDHIFSGNAGVPYHSEVTSNVGELSKILKGQPSTGAVTTRSTYEAQTQPTAEADFSDDLLKVEAPQPSQNSPRLKRVTQMVADLRQSKPFAKYKDRPAVLAQSAELVLAIFRHIEREVAAA